MDLKKETKQFINYICDQIQGEEALMGRFNTCDDLGYFMKDKGIDKRIEKKMLKRCGVKVEASYELNEHGYLLKVRKTKEPFYEEKLIWRK